MVASIRAWRAKYRCISNYPHKIFNNKTRSHLSSRSPHAPRHGPFAVGRPRPLPTERSCANNHGNREDGKGPPAALLAALMHESLAAQAHASDGPAATMAAVNTAVVRRGTQGPFDPCIYCVGVGSELELSDLSHEARVFEVNLTAMVRTLEILRAGSRPFVCGGLGRFGLSGGRAGRAGGTGGDGPTWHFHRALSRNRCQAMDIHSSMRLVGAGSSVYRTRDP